MSIALAGVSAARRFGGRVLDIALAGGSSARQFGGRVLDIALAGGSGARRFDRRVLNVTWAGDVHAGPVTMEVAKIAVGEGNSRNGGGATGRRRD